MQVFHGNINFVVPWQNNSVRMWSWRNFQHHSVSDFSCKNMNRWINIVIREALKSIDTCHRDLDSSQLSFSSHYHTIAWQIFLEKRIFNFIFSDCGSWVWWVVHGIGFIWIRDLILYSFLYSLSALINHAAVKREVGRDWGSLVSWEEFFRTWIRVSLKYSK